MSRREFCELMLACAIVGAASIGWDVAVNEGRPAEGDGEEPP